MCIKRVNSFDELSNLYSNLKGLLDIKKGKWELAAARSLAEQSLAHVIEVSDAACDLLEDKENPEMRDLLEDVCYNIMKISVEKELRV